MIRVFPDLERLSREAAEQFVRLAQERAQAGCRFSVALAGGSTPRRLYELLADEPYRSRVPWECVHVFWGDERCVPPTHPASNFRMVHDLLLSRVPLPAVNVCQVSMEQGDPTLAAALYEHTLRAFFQWSPTGTARGSTTSSFGSLRSLRTTPRPLAGDIPSEGPRPEAVGRVEGSQDEAWPAFDLVLLGLGEDGHTASLFPHSPVLKEMRHLVAPTTGGDPNLPRVTLTVPVLNHAAHLIWLVAGAEKAPVVHAVLEGPQRPEEFPAQLVRPAHGALWFLDRAAASLLRADAAHDSQTR